ncbi:MAG: hypothetical protein ACN4EU_04130 [Brevundimonas mediterranea]|nr:hypothetical protein [Brevundimonas aurantiaca]
MRRRWSPARRPRFARTLTPHGLGALIVCAVVALICARLFGGA